MIIELFIYLEVKSLGNQRVKYLLHSSREVADPCYIEHKIFSSSLYPCSMRAGRPRAIHTAVSVSRAAEGRRGISTGLVNLVRDE